MGRNLLPPVIEAEDWLADNAVIVPDSQFTFAESFSFRLDLIAGKRVYADDSATGIETSAFGVGANPISGSDRGSAVASGSTSVTVSADDTGSGTEAGYANAAFGNDSAMGLEDFSVTVVALPVFIFASDAASIVDSGSHDMPSWDNLGLWNLKFEDDFDTLNTSVWQPNWQGSDNVSITPPVSTSEQACYDPAQVSVASSILHLAVQPVSTTVAGNVYQYRSGMINSLGTEAFNCAATGQLAVEASINLAGTAGVIANFPTFRLVGLNSPTTGETDIIAGVGGAAQYQWRGPDTGLGVGGSVVGDYTGWHTYGMVLTPSAVRFYYDGVLVGSVATNASGASWSPSPLYLILNHGIAGGDTPQVVDMMVDWVRVWE